MVFTGRAVLPLLLAVKSNKLYRNPTNLAVLLFNDPASGRLSFFDNLSQQYAGKSV